MKIEFQQNKWHGDMPVTIELPDDWQIFHDTMKCDTLPKLTAEQIRSKIEAPIGCPQLAEMAKGKQRVCIIFDDMSRPTPSQELAEPVLDILLSAGVKKENIIFMCGSGNHGALTREDFVKKLGEKIVTDYFVYNHNPYDNLVKIGTTKSGIDVLLNKEVAQCDLIVGLGAMIPHAANGFSGGYKLIFPGVAGIETMGRVHTNGFLETMEGLKDAPYKIPMGHLPKRGMRFEIEECGKMVQIPIFKVDCFINTRSQIVDIFAGDPIAEYYEAAKSCETMYQITPPGAVDVIIVNSNFKSNESNVAYGIARSYLGATTKKGDIVLVNFAKSGQVPHFMIGHFGRTTKARLCRGVAPDPRTEGKSIYFSPYGDKSAMDEIGMAADRYVWAKTWDEVMNALTWKGPGTRVLIIDEGAVASFKE